MDLWEIKKENYAENGLRDGLAHNVIFMYIRRRKSKVNELQYSVLSVPWSISIVSIVYL